LERYPSGQRDQTVNLAAYVFEGSNPSLSTIFNKKENGELVGIDQEKLGAGVAQLARASAFQAEGRGFESRLPLQTNVAMNALVAQLARALPW
jgi:hypothetical protein